LSNDEAVMGRVVELLKVNLGGDGQPFHIISIAYMSSAILVVNISH
jgi:hypothetical protein